MPGAFALSDGEIDLVRRVVRRARRTAVLTPSESALLELLARTPGAVVSREALQAQLVASRGVDRLVYRVRAKIELDPTRPAHLLTAHGAGYVLVPAVAPIRPVRTNLPEPREALVGREALLDTIAGRWPGSDSVGRLALTGPAGIGKSRLAEELARRSLAAWAVGGAWRVELGDARSEEDVVALLAGALDLASEGTTAHLLRAASAVLAGAGPALVVLDDVDHVVDAARRIVLAMPGVAFLCTGRVAFDPGIPSVEVPPLAEPDATTLLLHRATEVGAPIGAGDPAIARIVAATDGVPLALELAASRIRALSPSTVATSLETHPLRTLRQSGRTAAHRHASFAAALAWSWDTLTEAQRRALAAAAIFEDTFSPRLADRVVPGGAEAARELVPLGMVREVHDGRLHVPPVVREFVRARVPCPDAAERLVTACVDLARELLAVRPASWSAIQTFRTEAVYLRSSLVATREPDPEAAGWLGLALVIGHRRELGPEEVRAVALALRPGELRILLRICEVWAWAHRGAWDRALAPAREAVAEAETEAEVVGRVRALGALSSCLVHAREPEAAIAAARRAVEIVGDLAEMRVVANGMLGTTLLSVGHPDAQAQLEVAVALARDADSTLFLPWVTNLASCRFMAGDAAGARRLSEEALATADRLGLRRAEAVLRFNLAWNDLLLGDLDGAMPQFDAVSDTYRAAGEPESAAWSRLVAATIRAVQDQWVDARSDLVALDLSDATGQGRARLAAVAAAIRARDGDVDGARDLLDLTGPELAAVLGGEDALEQLRAACDAGRGFDLPAIGVATELRTLVRMLLPVTR